MKHFSKPLIKVFAIVFFLLFTMLSRAQTNQPGSLTGRILNKSREAVADVSVSVENGKYVSSTDKNGDYILKLPPGDYTVKISHVLFGTITSKVHIGAGSTVELAPELTETANALDEVVITASGMPAELRTIASNISVLQATDPELRQLQTIDDALYYTPGLNISRNRGLTTTGTHTSVTMRGTGSSNRTLILKDGIPINDAYTGGITEWNSTATGSIARIEVVRGPGSALHGSNSMGGTINLITQSPTEKPVLGADLRYGSMNTLQAGAKAGKLFKNGLGVMVFGEYKKTGGYQYMADSLWKSYYPKPRMALLNLNAKLSYTLRTGDKIEAIADHHYQSPYSGTATVYDDNTRISNYSLKYTGQSKFFGYQLITYYNHQDRVSDAYQWSNTTLAYDKRNYTSETGIDLYGALAKISRRFRGHTVTVGGDLRYTSADYNRLTFATGTQHFSGDQNFISFFANDEISLGAKINVNLGLRYDYWENTKGHLFDNSGKSEVNLDYSNASANIFSPKLGIVYRATNNLRFRSQFAQGFRAPSIYYLYTSGPLGTSYFRLGNPDLKPERMVYSVELGADWNLGRQFELSVTGFVSQYRDFNESVQVDNSKVPSHLSTGGLPVRQYVNIGKVGLGGIESSLRFALTKNFSLIGSYFYNRSKILKYETNTAYEGNEMDGNPRHTLSSGVVFDLPSKLNIGFWIRHTTKSFGNLENSAARIMPAAAIADLKLSYQLGRMSFNINVQNLFDKQYYGSYTSATSYYYAPPRTANVGLSFNL